MIGVVRGIRDGGAAVGGGASSDAINQGGRDAGGAVDDVAGNNSLSAASKCSASAWTLAAPCQSADSAPLHRRHRPYLPYLFRPTALQKVDGTIEGFDVHLGHDRGIDERSSSNVVQRGRELIRWWTHLA